MSTPLRDLHLASVLLTRLPLPDLPDDAFYDQARAAWAYPFAGLVVAVLALAAGGIATLLGLPEPAVAGITLATLMMATGALHEDGLADTADGLWGGQDRARRLEIMKDSRIGSYGVLALIVLTVSRWIGIEGTSGWALVGAAMASRALMPAVMAALPAARPDGLSARVGRPELATAGVALVIGTIAMLATAGIAGLGALILAMLAAFVLSTLARSKIGGQTGDILGAVQVVGEAVILLVLAT